MIVAHLQHHLTNYPDTDIQDLNTRLANSEFEKDLIVEERNIYFTVMQRHHDTYELIGILHDTCEVKIGNFKSLRRAKTACKRALNARRFSVRHGMFCQTFEI